MEVSDTQALLESMLQKLQLNTHTSRSSISSMQAANPSGNRIPDPVEGSSKTACNSKSSDKSTTVWNTFDSPWNEQLKSPLAPMAKQPVKRITKHSGFSAKPKRSPLIWGENKHSMSERKNAMSSCVDDQQIPKLRQQFSLEDKGPSLNQSEYLQNPPDVLAQTLMLPPSGLESPWDKGQNGTWKRIPGTERNTDSGVNEHSGKAQQTSRKRWRDAGRWAQNVKERWRERQRSSQSRHREDVLAQAQEQIDAHSPQAAPSEPVIISNKQHETTSTALEEEGEDSLGYLSDGVFTFGTTSNLMEEIFSGTEWAQFLSVNHTTKDQSNEPPSFIDQSREEEHSSELIQKDACSPGSPSPLVMVAPLHPCSELSSSDIYINPPTNADLQNPFSERSPAELISSEAKLGFAQASERTKTPTEDFIPVLDLSYVKPRQESTNTSKGSLSRKREHWTNRRASFEHTAQDMEDHSSFIMDTESSKSIHGISSISSLNSLPDSTSEDLSLETAVKKMRMDATRRVRFSEEVVILPTCYLPEYNEDEDEDEEDDDYDDEEEDEEEQEQEEVEELEKNEYPQVQSPRTSLPKWIMSLKGKSSKYRF
ncbi:hypothetical protein DNTS_014664 [Danionella cerebrum]|uniref:Uncharacterized protein n=1 Tax=Danionella cerebrum TaxID=2873325 RepID=A0A553Q1W7_9TELE|nr:hypothetical protein DNTS_014664 [Danionella translucida]